jgi:hypothetical protein
MGLGRAAATGFSLLTDFFVAPFFYACLLPPVVGPMSLMASWFASIVSAVNPLRLVASLSFGVGKQSS